MIRRKYPHVAVLDLGKACDCVLRDLLHVMIEEQLPETLSTMLRPLLWPMRLRTEQEKTDVTVMKLAGMPQGDRSSPIIFTLFMESYIRRIKITPRRGLVSLSLDDVLLLSRTIAGMQEMLI